MNENFSPFEAGSAATGNPVSQCVAITTSPSGTEHARSEPRAVTRRPAKSCRGSRSRGSLAPADFVAQCLEALGPLEVSESTHSELLDHAQEDGNLNWGTDEERAASEKRVGIMLALIAASRDYQFA